MLKSNQIVATLIRAHLDSHTHPAVCTIKLHRAGIIKPQEFNIHHIQFYNITIYPLENIPYLITTLPSITALINVEAQSDTNANQESKAGWIGWI